MKIQRLEVFHVALPLIEPWRTAYGEDPVIESVLVRAFGATAEGRAAGCATWDAWGEATPFGQPTYSPETAGTAALVIERSLGPAVVGRDLVDAAALNERLAVFRGNPFAKAAVETAFWGLLCRQAGQPLHAMIGGADGEVPAGEDFGVCDTIDALLGRVGGAVEAGFGRVKLKVRRGWDLEVVRAVRAAFPNLVFHVDCNGGYSLDDLDLFKRLDAFNLAMIEQPLAHDDLLDHAELARRVATPICLDESLKSPRWAEQAVRLGACRVLNVKPGRVGGIAHAAAMVELARREGLGCWIGGMLESSVGAAVCIELASLPGNTYPADIFPSSKFYTEDLCEPAVTPRRPGVFGVSTGPWIDYAPSPDRLARRTLRKATVGA